MIFHLKSPNDTDCFIPYGAKLEISGPKWDRVSVSL